MITKKTIYRSEAQAHPRLTDKTKYTLTCLMEEKNTNLRTMKRKKYDLKIEKLKE